MVQPLIIRGAQVWDGNSVTQRDLYTDGERIATQPVPDALTVDLEGYTIFPGLINAHDHLELNHYPRSKFREKYNNAHEWGEDMNARLNDEPYKSLRAYPLDDRCFIGGLKNLLCGATTVAHHNPPHKCLFRKDFPVRVLRKYGWAHSLHFNTEKEIVQSYRSTPKDWPWFIHLAEGTDEVAAGEYQRLKGLGCVGRNTVIVHGVGMTEEDIADAAPQVRGLVWCPQTNKYLLGKAGETMARNWTRYSGTIAFGSDSRITAYGDLLDEKSLSDNSSIGGLTWMIRNPAKILSGKPCSPLSVGEFGDFFASQNLLFRESIALIVKGGVPQIGDPEVMTKFPYIQTVGATLDGKPKAIHIDLARRIHRCSLKEPGLEVEALPRRRFRLRP